MIDKFWFFRLHSVVVGAVVIIIVVIVVVLECMSSQEPEYLEVSGLLLFSN